MPYKTIVTDGDQLADKAVRLNACSFSHRYAFLYFGKRPYKTIIAQHTPVQVYRLYHGNIAAECHPVYSRCFYDRLIQIPESLSVLRKQTPGPFKKARLALAIVIIRLRIPVPISVTITVVTAIPAFQGDIIHYNGKMR